MWQSPELFARLAHDFLAAPEPLRMQLPGGAVERTPSARLGPPRPLAEEMPLRTRYLRVGRHTIHLRTGRSEPAHAEPSFILVHGYVISSSYFVPTAELLAPRYPTYALDMPGFGWSAKPRRALSVPELADAVVEAQAALGHAHSVFVGNSFGCQVVADIAARHPKRVSAAVLTGPTFERGRSLLPDHQPSLA
jgi:2-hydroxy-6-oxonona-2,4-dienedioate hydrolase